MIGTTETYKRELIKGNRNYVVKAEVTLADETELTLTNEQLWEQGVVLTNSISSDSNFDIGSAIIGNLTLTLNNIDGDFNTYDFINAKIVLWIGLTNDVDENDDQIYYRIGFYVVDDTQYNGSLITLDCLDNLTWFDVPFSGVTGISYPTTAGQLVSAICSYVGVTLDTNPPFPNYSRTITAASGAWLSENEVNCREVLQYVAQKCCCYCKINTAGQLVLAWYDKDLINNIINYDGGTFDTTTTPYSDGDDLEGGDFFDYSTQAYNGGSFNDTFSQVWLSQNYEMNVSVEDIVVTGCRIVSTNSDNEYDELCVDADLELTHERYVLVIENNPLIVASEAADLAQSICATLAGLPIRAFTSRSANDISYETGDMVTLVDFRSNVYYSWITSFTFTISNSENFSCGAQSVRQKSETRYSEAAKTLAEAQQSANNMLNAYDSAVKSMNELAQDAIGYNQYQYSVGGGIVTWLYNGNEIVTTDPENPTFPHSTVVFKISGDGVFISNDGGTTYSQGYDANSGTAILSLIYAVGINCDWIHAGQLTLGGLNNANGQLVVNDANGDEIGRWDNSGLSIYAGDLLTIDTQIDSQGNRNYCEIDNGKLIFGSYNDNTEVYTQGANIKYEYRSSLNSYNLSLNAAAPSYNDRYANIYMSGNGSVSIGARSGSNFVDVEVAGGGKRFSVMLPSATVFEIDNYDVTFDCDEFNIKADYDIKVKDSNGQMQTGVTDTITISGVTFVFIKGLLVAIQ